MAIAKDLGNEGCGNPELHIMHPKADPEMTSRMQIDKRPFVLKCNVVLSTISRVLNRVK